MKAKKETIKLEEDILKMTIGDVLNLTADENNPVSSGLEFKGDEKHE